MSGGQRFTLADIKLGQDLLRKLPSQNPASARYSLDQLTAWLLRHAPSLIEIAAEKLERTDCARCSGCGNRYVIIACDDGYWERCSDCSGTGKQELNL